MFLNSTLSLWILTFKVHDYPLHLCYEPIDVDRSTKSREGQEGQTRQQGAFHQQIVLAWRLCDPR